ncbi:MAG: histidine kinase [Bacteroidota bacterium]
MKLRSLSTSRFSTIIIHLILWLTWFILPYLFSDSPEEGFDHLLKSSAWLVLLVGLFYLNTSTLIPRYFLQGKIWKYIFIWIGFIILTAFLNACWGNFLDSLGLISRHHSFAKRLYFPVVPCIMVFALSTAIRISNEWFKNEKQIKEMENQKLTAELAFLKSQVNPHFLFNILNNICSLARKKSDDTENALIKLSRIMRYMLYESKDEKVNLEKEVEYLNSYIELQKLRISENVVIHFTITGDPASLMVEPMLLIPFVENAFKHGVSYLDESIINITLFVDRKTLVFKVDNTIAPNRDTTLPSDSGIGLKNVVRRLELLYPGRHTLNVNDNGLIYKIDLQISL